MYRSDQIKANHNGLIWKKKGAKRKEGKEKNIR